jgi:dTDP-4-dehydrorhamnose 3,5-epimerase
MIKGTIVKELKQIKDERGKVMHMIRSDSELFKGFGEVYFSVVNPGVVKAWKRHREMTQHFAVPVGAIRLVMFDDRDGSPTNGQVDALEIGEENYCLVRIPPGVWYGFKGTSKAPAMIANCTDIPHDPKETDKREESDDRIPYVWR